MPDRILKIHPQAEAEIAEARDWYAARSPDTARRFLTEVDRAMAHICEDPLLSPTYPHGTRGYLLRHYRYLVVYDISETTIRVLALAHTSRKPGYWTKRVRENGGR